MVCWNLADIGYCLGVCFLSLVLHSLNLVSLSVPLFSILEAVFLATMLGHIYRGMT